MDSKKSLYIVVALIAGLGIGFIGGRGAESGMLASGQEQKLRAQIEQAKKFFPPTPSDVRTLSGIVKEIRGSTIVMDVSPANPFDESPRSRNVTLASGAKIVRTEQKDPAAYQREIADFQKAIQSRNKAGTAPVSLPNPFRETPAQLSDIRVGGQISVTSGENIRDKESFTADIVSILNFSGVGSLKR